jgi:hypothetical protein
MEIVILFVCLFVCPSTPLTLPGNRLYNVHVLYATVCYGAADGDMAMSPNVYSSFFHPRDVSSLRCCIPQIIPLCLQCFFDIPLDFTECPSLETGCTMYMYTAECYGAVDDDVAVRPSIKCPPRFLPHSSISQMLHPSYHTFLSSF